MELPKIGQQCAMPHCKQLDFLPLVCDCKLVFCREHFTQHVETCPYNKKIEKEIDVNKRIDTYQCSEPGCSEKSVIPIICEKCKEHFCVTHRHTPGFGCELIDEKKLRQSIEKFNAPIKQFEEAKIAVDIEVEKKIAIAKRKNKNLSTANQVQLMRIKAKATGLRSIPTTDRLYFSIFNQKYCPNGRPVFISRDWTIGRIIDTIAEECKIPNNNNKTTAQKLRLFKKSDQQVLTENMSDKIINFIDNSIIINGDNLILDYSN